MFLAKTVENLLENIEGQTEIIVVLDGEWADPPVPVHERVTVLHHNVSVGQRAATNQAARLSKAKYVMKVDAHCAFDQGFDVKLMALMQDDYTMIPTMYNLHGFDWVCPQGHRRYQGPSGPCTDCGQPTTREVLWQPRHHKKSEFYRFDTDLHFQYHGDRKKYAGDGQLVETMSAQGSCFLLTRDKYWELNISDEGHGSWGQQGTEVACKTWLSGGRLVTNRTTWYAHMFRTQGGDFGFPYPLGGNQQEKARQYSRDLWFNNKFDRQIRPLSWLIEKFKPLPGWHDPEGAEMLAKVNQAGRKFYSRPGASQAPTKGIIYYTDNQLSLKVARPVQGQLRRLSDQLRLPIVSASLKKMSFGKNVYFPHLKRGYLTMAKQILAALENSTADVIYFCEHDVLYHASHFEFTPPDKQTFYYNENAWFLRSTDGHCLHYDVKQLSGLCVYRETAIAHFKERVALIEKDGFTRNMGFEPMTHGRIKWQNQYPCGEWLSPYPNVDIKHGGNLTGQRWSKDKFRNQSLLKNWTESDTIPGWGPGPELVKKYALA